MYQLKPTFKQEMKFLVSGILLVYLVLNSGCGRIGIGEVNENSNSLLSMAIAKCNNELREVYKTTYFPIMSGVCNECHKTSQGSKDLKVSYQVFVQKSKATIEEAIDQIHVGKYNTESVLGAMKQQEGKWNPAFSRYTECLEAAGQIGESFDILTKADVIPNIESTRPPAGSQTSNTWVPMSFDLEYPENTKRNGMVPAIFTVKAQYFVSGGLVVGVKFKDPALRVKQSGQAIVYKDGITLRIDELIAFNFTTWKSFNGSVNTTTDTIINPGQAGVAAIASFEKFGPTNKIAFKFADIRKGEGGGSGGGGGGGGTGSNVTWTQLTGSGGVFARNCLSCHGQGGRFPNLSDYNVASAQANTIITRMRDGGDPMPTAGLLSNTEVDQVQNWINGGRQR